MTGPVAITAGAQGDFAAALLDASLPPPAGLRAWNGSDVARRFGVHRNNVIVSLVGVLADGFPVVRRIVGGDFFDAMARRHVVEQPPLSPVMTDYGCGFADWIDHFEPAAALPWLGEMARLERARVRACHAADAPALPAAALAAAMSAPDRLATMRLPLHPSACVLHARHAVVSLWAAHQHDGDDAIGCVDLDRPESALVLRDAADDVLVLPLAPADAAFVDALRRGATLGNAAASAPGADLACVLALLLRHGALVADPGSEEVLR